MKRKRETVVTRTCRCGRSFTPSAEEIKVERGLYCSIECAGMASRGKPKAPRGSNRINAKTRGEWYNAYLWQAFSEELRAEVGSCGRCGATAPLCVHHKVDPFPTRNVGLLFDFENLEVICTPCHAREHHAQGGSSTCKRCGVVFGHALSHARVYCSRACDFAARREEARPPRDCAVCGTSFRPTSEKAMCCSFKCGQVQHSRTCEAKKPRFTCPVCKTEFTMPKSQAARGIVEPCCSRPCALKKRFAAGWNPRRTRQKQPAA